MLTPEARSELAAIDRELIEFEDALDTVGQLWVEALVHLAEAYRAFWVAAPVVVIFCAALAERALPGLRHVHQDFYAAASALPFILLLAGLTASAKALPSFDRDRSWRQRGQCILGFAVLTALLALLAEVGALAALAVGRSTPFLFVIVALALVLEGVLVVAAVVAQAAIPDAIRSDEDMRHELAVLKRRLARIHADVAGA